MIRSSTILAVVLGLISVIPASDAISGEISTQSIKQAIYTYFQTTLDVDQADLEIEFVRLPRITQFDHSGNRFRIRSQRATTDLGYQILWLELYADDNLLKKYPLSVRVSILTAVVIPVHNLNRGELITAEKLCLENRLLNTAYGTQISAYEQVVGLVARRVIRAGTVIRENMVRKAPDILRGATVEILLETGNMVIRTEGIAKQEGSVGDEVAVFCPETRKFLAGKIQSSNLILVK